MEFTNVSLVAALLLAPGGSDVGNDLSLDISLKRCQLLGYEKDTDPWRECIREQLRNVSQTAHKESSEITSASPSDVNPEKPASSPVTEPINRPPQIKDAGSSRDQRRCAREYEGPQRVFEVEIEVGVDGKAIIVGLPAGTSKDVEDVARCTVALIEFMPGMRNSVPIAARAMLPLTLGLAGPNGKLPKMTPPKYLGVNAEKAEGCYPPSYESTRVQPVVVEVLVGKEGGIEQASVVKQEGSSFVKSTAECIAWAANFAAGTINGSPKAMRTNVTVSVKLP